MTGPLNGKEEGGEASPFSLSKLIKLLKLTTSDNNAEALLAMRKANDELRKLNLDWEGLLKGKITVIGDPFAEASRPNIKAAAPPPPPKPSAPPHYHYHTNLHPPRPRATKSSPPLAKDITVTNKFGGSCISCGTWVEAGQGKATKSAGAGQFVVHHISCQATLRKHQAPNLDQL